jgi:membrane protease YdiL (CAAX protease family)
MEGQPQESPEYTEPVIPVEPIIEDNKWFGVPPKGIHPLPPKWIYVLMVLGVIALEIGIWAVYRYFSAPLFAGFGTELFYLVHIIAAPTIHIVPILLFWKYVWKEPGLPFVFTKKLIMSGVIVGFIGAIIWRFLEEGIYDGVAGAAGGTVPGTFTLFNLMDSSTILLLSLMTFVHFFIVGPVEELEFRGFAQDQAARVIPNWQAVWFSSVLFGCSHIPIALFVYKFPPHIFVVAFIGWISAGFVFGFLYMWSRNIYACIVMHGMGNWQLSIFYFQSTELVGGMNSFTTVAVGTVSSVIADVIMICIFYLIHKNYWQPHRRGEPAFNGMFQKLQNFIHEHDFNKQPIQATAAILVGFIVVICMILMGITAAFGETDLSMMYTTSLEDTGGSGSGAFDDFIVTTETMQHTTTLMEGMTWHTEPYSQQDRYIKGVNITVKWTDEDDMQYGPRTYYNEPDTITVTITGPNASVKETASNPQGGEGEISLHLSYTNEEIENIIETEGENYEFIVEVTLDDAGDYFSNFGVFGFTDTENEVFIEWEIIELIPDPGK